MYKGLSGTENTMKPLILEIMKNFEYGAKTTVTLIPQIIFGQGVSQTTQGLSLNKFGEINDSELLEICQAGERYFRKKVSDNQIKIQR